MRSTYLSLALLLGANTIAGAQENGLVPQQLKRTAPVSRMLSRSELKTYLKNKKVALFGESHTVDLDGRIFDDLRDDVRFRKILPMLKQLGYTHVALEIEYHFEEQVQRGIRNINQAMDGGIGMTAATIAPVALDYGLRVICIDNRDVGRKELRDEYMEQRIARVVASGGKVAYYVGSRHLETVTYSSDIATVELNPLLLGQSEIVSNKIESYGAKPLGRRLVERYGPQQVALVNMENCSDATIPTCFLE